MKLNKKLLTAGLVLASAFGLASCDAKPNNTKTPYGTITDTVYASALNGKYEVTEKQVYTKLRQNAYTDFTKKIYSTVFANEINEIISGYNNNAEITEDINNAVASSCYATTDAQTLESKDAKTLKNNKLTFINTMAKNGITITEDNLVYELVDSNEDGEKDLIKFTNLTNDIIKYYAYDLGLKLASKNYISNIVDEEKIYDYGKEEMVDNTYYINNETIKSRYNNSYKDYNTTKAIIIRFNSLRDAQNAIAKVNTSIEENPLQFYVDLYNSYYSYRNELKIENGTLTDSTALTYVTDNKTNELNSISTNFVTFYQDALVDGGYATNSVVDGSYTAFPRSIDDKYFMIYRIETKYLIEEEYGIDTDEAVKFDELEEKLGETKYNQLVEKLTEEIIDSKASSSMAISTVFKNLLIDGNGDQEIDDVLDIEIYDPFYEYKFYTTYSNDDYYSYTKKRDFNNELLCTIVYNDTTTEIKVDDFFAELGAYKGADIATTYLLNSYLVDTYFDNWIDDDKEDELNETFKNAVKAFKKDEAAYPKFLGVNQYYTINYGYATKQEILEQNLYASYLLSTYSSTYYRDGYFVASEGKYVINEDVQIFNNMLKYIENVYDSMFSLSSNHFLISVDDNCDGTIDDPAEFTKNFTEAELADFNNAVLALSKALITEAELIDTDHHTALQYLVKAYNQGLALQSEAYAGKTWDDFKYPYNFKITVESLGKITQSSVTNYVEPFADYVKETYKQVSNYKLDFEDDQQYFFLNGLTDEKGNTDLSKLTMDNLCETVYGYHVLLVTDYETPTSAAYSNNGNYDSIRVVVDELDEDDDNDDIYFVTNAYNETENAISINQLYLYFYEYLIHGSVTSIPSTLKTNISNIASSVISRYTNTTFQKWLVLNELGEVTFASDVELTYTYDDFITAIEVSIDGYDVAKEFEGWFEEDWTLNVK